MAKFTISGFYDEVSGDLNTQIAEIKKLGESYLCPRTVNGKSIADFTAEEFKRDIKPILDKEGIKFSSIGSPIGKVNIDDEAGKRLSEELSGVRQIRISEKDKSAELFMKTEKISDDGSEVVFTFGGVSRKVKIPLVGNFNIYNTAGAFAAASLFIGVEKAFRRIENNPYVF